MSPLLPCHTLRMDLSLLLLSLLLAFLTLALVTHLFITALGKAEFLSPAP